jgi:hypothetical protein
MLEGARGVAVAQMAVNLDYPKVEPDSIEVCFEGGEWRSVPLRGSWFDEAFEGPMRNLQRFAAHEDAVLVTRVDDALRTMDLVERCYSPRGRRMTATVGRRTRRGTSTISEGGLGLARHLP